LLLLMHHSQLFISLLQLLLQALHQRLRVLNLISTLNVSVGRVLGCPDWRVSRGRLEGQPEGVQALPQLRLEALHVLTHRVQVLLQRRVGHVPPLEGGGQPLPDALALVSDLLACLPRLLTSGTTLLLKRVEVARFLHAVDDLPLLLHDGAQRRCIVQRLALGLDYGLELVSQQLVSPRMHVRALRIPNKT
jgi:hypothetical protein